MTAPLPVGFRLRPDRSTRRLAADHLLVGGAPRRVLRLSDRGARVAAALLDGAAVTTHADATLARRLVDAGLAEPVPPRPASHPLTMQVVVPAYADAAALDRCLARLGRADVTVVDDGSPNAAEVAAVAGRHGARLVRRPHNGGPAAARNTGTAHAGADVVAFVDSDALVDSSALDTLLAHFADDHVVAVAPRVRTADSAATALGALAQWWSPLDLGASPSRVAPGQRVPYVPSTVLLVRRAALVAAGGFDEGLRYGEDVDLVWRLARQGATIRYDPGESVAHREPAVWTHWLRRRFRYGTSAGPLACRHRAAAVTLSVHPAPLATVLLLALRRPAAAGAVAAVTAARVHRRLRQVDVPVAVAGPGALLAPAHTALAAARWLTQLWWPALVAAAVAVPRTRGPVVAALTAPPLVEWARRRPRLDPLRWTGAVLLDDVAYGAGVWRGAVGARTARPLLPRLR